MHNLLRTLVYGEQVSLTLADTTELVREGIRLHGLSKDAAYVFGKTLSAMAFMSACLKNERGEISLALKTDGACGDVGISGNQALHLRGYMIHTQAFGNERTVFGEQGALTIIRDDGYTMPFVGASPLKNGSVDESFEEYFTISEQLPTRLRTVVETDNNGQVVFCGVAALQPLPFADSETLKKVAEFPLEDLLSCIKQEGVNACAQQWFKKTSAVWEERYVQYKCNCSRDYVSRVLFSLGETQTQELIREEGAVKVHCHYCNTDYEFSQQDADEIFSEHQL